MAALTPFLLLAVVEVLLRISGYGHAPGFFLRQQVQGREVVVANQQFGRRFFPREMARTPQPVMFPARKAPGVTRVFVLGESAAMGDPEPAFGLPRLLQAMLELKFPSNRFEVINVAMTAINSHVIREIARDCAPLEGDVWVLYMGNNEVVGPFGGGTVFGRQAPGLGFIRASIWLKQFRLVQLVGSIRARGGPAEWGGMEMFLKQQVTHDDPRMATVREHFARNLDEIIRAGVESDAKVVVGTVAVNLRDCPPFAAMGRPRDGATEFDRNHARGLQLAGSNRFAEAHAAFKAAAISGGAGEGSADMAYQLGRCELALGSNDAARASFNLAKELDTLRFRADDAINEAIRQHAATKHHQETLVDVESAIQAVSSNGIAGAEAFLEHVHFTFEGNYQVARAFFGAVVAALPGSVTKGASADVPSLEDCARRLGWNDWERLQVYEEVRKRLQQPPFTAQFGHAERDAEWKQRIDELGASLTGAKYERIKAESLQAIDAAPGDWVLRENFARLLESNGDTAQALVQWREVMRLLPFEPLAFYHTGNLLDSTGRSREALPFFREALRLNPESTETRNGLALALSGAGQVEEAERQLRTILRFKPKSAEARVNLGQLLAQQGRTNEAMAEYEQALAHDTNSTAAHVNLGRLLNQRGDRDGAVAHYEAAVRINPRHAVAHYNLGNAHAARNSPGARHHYQEAVRAKPNFAEAHVALALEMAKAGDGAGALSHLDEAIRLQPDSPDAHFNRGVLLARSGKHAEAAQSFARTLRLQPGHPQAREFLQRVQSMK